ncbi:MAG: band-7 C-terminal domain-containing protein [Lysobacterales bacterium]
MALDGGAVRQIPHHDDARTTFSAKATAVVSEAITKGDPRAINYFIAQKYVDALGQLAASPNNKVMMIPLEATSVIGSIAGIGEIAKEVFNGQPA